MPEVVEDFFLLAGPMLGVHPKEIAKGKHCYRVGRVPKNLWTTGDLLLNLKTGRVEGYTEGQAPLIYLTTTLQRVVAAGRKFVFSDGHGLAIFTNWYDDLTQLDKVDWDLVIARYWADRPDDNDRQRRKQAEFLIWQTVDWSLIESIGVLNQQVKLNVEAVLRQYPNRPQPRVEVRSEWYYY